MYTDSENDGDYSNVYYQFERTNTNYDKVWAISSEPYRDGSKWWGPYYYYILKYEGNDVLKNEPILSEVTYETEFNDD